MSVFSAIEGSLKIQGTVSGTDATVVRLDEPSHALKIYLQNPPNTTIVVGDVTPNTLVGTDGITVISGSNFTTIQGFRPEFVAASGFLQSQITGGSVTSINATGGAVLITGTQNVSTQTVGQTITITGPDLSSFSSTSLVTTTSGFLQSQISSIVSDEIEPAITGTDGITITSGTSTTNVSGFRSEFVAASGSLQSQIANLDSIYATDAALVSVSGHLQTRIDAVESSDVDSVNAVTGSVLVTGTQNVTTQTVGQTITITGPDLSPYATTAYVNSVVDEIEPAITGTDGITITSGTSTTNIAGFRTEFVAASGSLQSQITTNTNSIANLDSIYATDTNLVSVSGHLQTQISALITDEIEPAIVSANALIVVTSGANTTTLTADTTPQFLSVEATTITGTTVQAGGTVSANHVTAITGTFTTGVTVGGSTTYVYPDEIRTPILTVQTINATGPFTAPTGAFSSSLTISGLPVSVGGGGGGIFNVVEDTSPQLGGNLDVNGFNITNAAGTTTIAVTVAGDINLSSADDISLTANGAAGTINITTLGATGNITISSSAAAILQSTATGGEAGIIADGSGAVAAMSASGPGGLVSIGAEGAGGLVAISAITGTIQIGNESSFPTALATGDLKIDRAGKLTFASNGAIAIKTLNAVLISGSTQVRIDAPNVNFPTSLTVSGVAVPIGARVDSLNSLTGAVTLSTGNNITITPAGNTLTFASTATGGGGGNALIGAGGTTIVSGTDTITISSQIDKAIVGSSFINVLSGTNTNTIIADAIISDSALLVVTSGANAVTLSPDTTPLFDTVTATTITGTTGQFGGNLSTNTLTAVTGTFTTGITIGGSTTYVYPNEIVTPLLTAQNITTTGPVVSPTGTFSTTLTISGVPVLHEGITGVTVSGLSLTKGQLNFIGSRGGNVSILGNTVTFDANPAGAAGGGGSGTPGGNDKEIQFNDGGQFGGDPTFTFNKTIDVLSVPTVVAATLSGTTVTGTTIQVGGTVSAHTGNFAHSLTISGIPVPLTAGGGGTTAFVHTQVSPANTWNVVHGLDSAFPHIQIYDTADVVIQPNSITATDNDTLTVTFNQSTSGTASVLKVGGGTVLGINNIVQDTTPELGGNLDAQNFNITNAGTLQATTVTGTTGQFGGTVSAHTGNFAHSLTISGIPVPLTGGGGGTPGGSNTQVQYNSTGSFAGDPTFTFNDGTNTISGSAMAMGGTLSAQNGNFSNSLTISGGAVSLNYLNVVNTDSLVIGNTAAEFPILTCIIPDRTLIPGRRLQARIVGLYFNNTAASRTYTYSVKYGGATLWSDLSSSMGDDGLNLGVLSVDLEFWNSGAATSNLWMNGTLFTSPGGAPTTGFGPNAGSSRASNPILASGTVGAGDKTLEVVFKHTSALTNAIYTRKLSWVRID